MGTIADNREARASREQVVAPHHYARFNIEPIRFIAANGLNWFQGNIIKYLCRHDEKNGLEDVRKAKRYLEMYEQFLMGNADWWKAPEGGQSPVKSLSDREMGRGWPWTC